MSVMSSSHIARGVMSLKRLCLSGKWPPPKNEVDWDHKAHNQLVFSAWHTSVREIAIALAEEESVPAKHDWSCVNLDTRLF